MAEFLQDHCEVDVASVKTCNIAQNILGSRSVLHEMRKEQSRLTDTPNCRLID